MERQEIAMLIIATSGEEGMSLQQMQTTLFLLGQTAPPDLPVNFYQFGIYSYGPFSKQIDADIDSLVEAGLLRHTRVPGQGVSKIAATSDGVEWSGKLQVGPNALVQHIEDAVRSLHSFRPGARRPRTSPSIPPRA